MNKRLIRLTEQDIHRIVKESVNRILMESILNFRGAGAYDGYERTPLADANNTTIEAKPILSMGELKTKLLNQQIEDVDSDNTFSFPTIGDTIYYNPPNFPYVVRKSMIVDKKVRPFLLYILKTGEEVVRVYRTRQEAITHSIKELESEIAIQKNSLVCTQYSVDKDERVLRVLKKHGKENVDNRTTSVDAIDTTNSRTVDRKGLDIFI